MIKLSKRERDLLKRLRNAQEEVRTSVLWIRLHSQALERNKAAARMIGAELRKLQKENRSK